MSIEISSGTIVTGASDDLIELNGELQEEFGEYNCCDGTMAFSDGTMLTVKYDDNGLWRFIPVYKGNLFEKVVQGDVEADTNDEVYFGSGLKWCCFSTDMQVEVNREVKNR